MPTGPGKYDAECTALFHQLKADGLVLIVLGAERGSGFSVTGDFRVTAALPDILRSTADQIEASFTKA